MFEHISHEADVILVNEHGLHVRPAALLAARARSFQAEVALLANGIRADCKSVLEILSCGCLAGTRITLSATGADSKEVVNCLAELIRRL